MFTRSVARWSARWPGPLVVLCLGLTMLVATASATATPARPHVGSSTTRLAGVAPTPAATARPNVVVFLTDDQRADSLNSSDRDVMPIVFSRLRDRGVRLTNYKVVNSWCCPGRTSLLTGNYSHTTKVWAIGGKYGGDAFDPSDTLATRLHDAGYRTSLVGKYLNHYTGGAPPGWDDFHAVENLNYQEVSGYYDYTMWENGQTVKYGHQPSDYATDVFSDRAASFIQSTPTSQPFFLYLAPTSPHGPPVPSVTYDGTLAKKVWPTPPTFCESDAALADMPLFMRQKPACETSRTSYSQARQKPAETLRSVDDAVGRVMDLIEARGQTSNTIFLFSSDNGLVQFEHRGQEKEVVYEESISVPAVIRYDQVLTPRVDKDLSGNIDINPTLLDLAGVRAGTTEGVSLRGSLLGQGPARRDLLVEHLQSSANDEGGPSFCAVRTQTQLYVEYATNEEELYLLGSDPYEQTNVADSSSQAALKSRLRARLKQLCVPKPPDPDLVLR